MYFISAMHNSRRAGLLVLIAGAFLCSGCDDVEIPEVDIDLPGMDSDETTTVEETSSEGGAADSEENQPAQPEMTPQAIIAAFSSKPTFSLTDDDVLRLATQKSVLDSVTELDLTSANLTRQSIEALKSFPALVKLNLEASRINGSDLQPLSELTQLEWLSLKRTGVDDPTLECVNNLSGLKYLDISETRVTDEGFVHLNGLSQLEEIHLGKLRISGAGMEALGAKGAKAPLLSIHAENTEFGRLGFVYVKEFDELETLSVPGALVTDNSLEGLRGANSLKTLILSGNMLTGGGVASLSRLRSLEVLHLNGMTPVNDASVAELRSLKNLKELNLSDTSCSQASVDAIKRVAPECEVMLGQ